MCLKKTGRQGEMAEESLFGDGRFMEVSGEFSLSGHLPRSSVWWRRGRRGAIFEPAAIF